MGGPSDGEAKKKENLRLLPGKAETRKVAVGLERRC